MLPLLATLAACADPAGDTALPSPYYVEDPAPATPALTPADAASAIDAVLAAAYTYDANDAHRAYDVVMVGADAGCPAVEAGEAGGSIWDDNCTSASGATFDGVVAAYNERDIDYARRMVGEATIALPDGTTFVLAGSADNEAVTGVSWRSSIVGVTRFSGALADGTWLEAGVDLNFGFAVEANASGGVETSVLTGTVGQLDGAVSAISVEDFRVSNAPDWPCVAEPAGTLAVRDATGVWVDVVFDIQGDEDSGFTLDPDGVCDGCGALWYDGASLGQVCVDVGPLLAATRPEWAW